MCEFDYLKRGSLICFNTSSCDLGLTFDTLFGDLHVARSHTWDPASLNVPGVILNLGVSKSGLLFTSIHTVSSI